MSYAGQDAVVIGGADSKKRGLRLHQYSLRTEQVYVAWIRRFLRENGRVHPRGLGAVEVEHSLSGLAVQHSVAPGTQNHALSALLFLYRKVLGWICPSWNRWCVRKAISFRRSCGSTSPSRSTHQSSSCPRAPGRLVGLQLRIEERLDAVEVLQRGGVTAVDRDVLVCIFEAVGVEALHDRV